VGSIKIRRILAIGVSVALLGATLVGAAPSGFQDYPNLLLDEQGNLDVTLVVGDDAHASDVVGSIEVATGLVAEFGREATFIPGLPEQATTKIKGDIIDLSKPNDLLEINEPLGDVREVLTDRDLDLLRGGVLTTTEGSTNYNQYLRFAATGTDAFNSSLVVKYTRDEEDNVGDFLFAEASSNKFMFEYQLEFSEGAESRIDASGNLQDLEDELVSIMGTPFSLVNTNIDTTAGKLSLTFLGGAVADLLEEGETKTYIIDDKEYIVKVLIISDVREAVKFEINGEVTDLLKNGESDILKDGTRIGIRDIFPNEAAEEFGGDLVEFYLGATKLVLEDTYIDSAFSGGVEVNDETIEDGVVQLKGFVKGTNKFELTSIKYRLEADALKGDLYLPPGGRLSEYLAEPEGMLSPNWDIIYQGLMDVDVSTLRFKSAGDDQYRILFTSNDGLNYKFDFLEEGSVLAGDDDHALIWIESDNSSDFNINEEDEFIVTDDNDETGDTSVISYEGFDAGDSVLVFTDLYGESREFTTRNTTTGVQSSLIFGGNTFQAFVGAGPGFPITVDLNNDGKIGDGTDANDACTKNIVGFSINSTGGLLDASEKVSSNDPVGPCRSTIVILGGGILDLGIEDGATNPLGPPGPVSGTFTVGIKTLESEFDESGPQDLGGDEVIAISFDSSGGELRATIEEDESRPPLDLQQDDETDTERAMTSYGVLISIDDDSNDAQDIIIEYPLLQRGANVFISTGDIGYREAGGEVPVQLPPLKEVTVGSAVLASEIDDISKKNTIILGGPCANRWAAQLMGNPQPCHRDFPRQTAYLSMYQHATGKIAILIAGYEAQDTRRASRVLAQPQNFDLSGSKIEVIGTSLQDIRIRTVS